VKDSPNKVPQKNDQREGENNWYADRYETIAVQRNMLFFISVVALVVTVISIIFVSKLTLSKRVVPLVVEIEDKTGFTNFVNPNEDQKWTTDQAVNTYFLVRYLRARETYNVGSYLYDYNTVVRLLSSPQVYRDFRDTLNDSKTNPVLVYGASNSTTLKIRSVQFLKISPSESNAQIRFAITEQGGARQTYYKIVSIVWSYIGMNLDFEDRTVNPLGFQVLSYAISNDFSA